MYKSIAGYGWFIRRINNALEKEANSNLQALNLTMQQNQVLVQLAHEAEHTLSLKALEDRFGAAQSTVAGLVSRLEKKGLVEPVSDPADRRIKRIRLTAEGARLHELSRQNVLASEERLTALLNDEEKVFLLACLKKVDEALK